MNLDHQMFGLPPEIGHSVVHHFSMGRERNSLHGVQLRGHPRDRVVLDA